MIQDENHPRMITAQQELLRRLGTVLGNGQHPLTKPFIDQLYDVVKDHRSECRAKGVDFPVMVAFLIPRLGVVDFVRADLDMPSIKLKLVNFIRQYRPPASMEEIVAGFRACFPDVKLDDLLSSAATGAQADARALERAERIGKEADEIADGQFGGEDLPGARKH